MLWFRYLPEHPDRVDRDFEAFTNKRVKFRLPLPVGGEAIVVHYESGGTIVGVAQGQPAYAATTADVEQSQLYLQYMGFREGGDISTVGVPVDVDGSMGAATKRAVRLFKALAWRFGNDGVLDGIDSDLTPSILDDLRHRACDTQWRDLRYAPHSALRHLDHNPPRPGDRFGYSGWLRMLRALLGDSDGSPDFLPRLVMNHVSLSIGGEYCSESGQVLHLTHQTGIDADFMAPTLSGEVKRILYTDAEYDRELMRRILSAAKGSGLSELIWFNDPVLIAEALCTPLAYHDDHAHVRLNRAAFVGTRLGQAVQQLEIPWLSLMGDLASDDELSLATVNVLRPWMHEQPGRTSTWCYSTNSAAIDFMGGALPVIEGAGHAIVFVLRRGVPLAAMNVSVRTTRTGLELRIGKRRLRLGNSKRSPTTGDSIRLRGRNYGLLGHDHRLLVRRGIA